MEGETQKRKGGSACAEKKFSDRTFVSGFVRRPSCVPKEFPLPSHGVQVVHPLHIPLGVLNSTKRQHGNEDLDYTMSFSPLLNSTDKILFCCRRRENRKLTFSCDWNGNFCGGRNGKRNPCDASMNWTDSFLLLGDLSVRFWRDTVSDGGHNADESIVQEYLIPKSCVLSPCRCNVWPHGQKKPIVPSDFLSFSHETSWHQMKRIMTCTCVLVFERNKALEKVAMLAHRRLPLY